MPQTNSWLCKYAIAQLGKPYLMGSAGEIRVSSQTELYQKDYVSTSDAYTNPNYDKEVKHHDCSGLIVGALTCDTVDGAPSGSTDVVHGATSQYNYNCRNKSNSMSNFPYIPGTLLFHNNDEGTKTHVGIYIGTFTDLNGDEHTDSVVEAKGRDWGVVISDLSAWKWNSWGQLSCCEVDTTKDTRFDARNLSAGNAAFNIDPTLMTPFVATVLPSHKAKIDYDRIKSARISAMMFYGGELYNASHLKQTYMNPHLDDLVQQCNNAGMLWSMYVNVRAKTVIEADAECRALYYVVSRHSPTMGLWLSLHLTNSVEVNNDILEVYYKYIDKWGLKARCGLYVTPTQLSKITWTTFQERCYLWMIDRMPISQVDDELLQPEMFEVPD